jgi:hypothetical protein
MKTCGNCPCTRGSETLSGGYVWCRLKEDFVLYSNEQCNIWNMFVTLRDKIKELNNEKR